MGKKHRKQKKKKKKTMVVKLQKIETHCLLCNRGREGTGQKKKIQKKASNQTHTHM